MAAARVGVTFRERRCSATRRRNLGPGLPGTLVRVTDRRDARLAGAFRAGLPFASNASAPLTP